MSQIRFLSFNIHGGRSLDGRRDLKRVHALLEKMDVDIAVFQEMETRPSRGGTDMDVEILAGTSRPYRIHGPSMTEDTGWYGNLIISRYPIIRSMVHNLETHPSLEPRNAVDALIDTPQGKLRIIGTHLSLVAWERWSEVKNLLRLMDRVESTEKNPVFLMGDINEWKRSSKMLRHLDTLMIQVPCAPSFPSRFPFLRLDRLWHDTRGLSVRARILREDGMWHLSDHLPMLIEVESSG